MKNNQELTDQEALFHLKNLSVRIAEFAVGKEVDRTGIPFQSINAMTLLKYGSGITVKIKCLSPVKLRNFKGSLLREIYKNENELDFSQSDPETFTVGKNKIIFGSGIGDITLELR